MSETDTVTEITKKEKRFGCLHMFGVALAVAVVTAACTAWWVKHNFYASPFSPTELSAQEKDVLEVKLDKLQGPVTPAAEGGSPMEEPYSEEGALREIRLTEKELNGLIAEDQETAKRVGIDLSRDLVSLRIVAPVDEDFPVLGGKTLRLKAGLTLAYREGAPVVALRGVTLGGVPLPNAWLGNLKGVNLVEEFGAGGGFWKLFSDGVEDVRVKEGHISITLRE